jgi:hypothetical protein
MTPTVRNQRGGRSTLADRSSPRQRERDHGERMASIRIVVGTGAAGVAHFDSRRRLGGADRDCRRCGCGQPDRATDHRLGQFPRRLRRNSPDLSRWRGNRPAHREKALLVEHVDRGRRLHRALPGSAPVRAFRGRLVVAPGADRRNRIVDNLGRGRLCGDDRDWIQQHRTRQDHSRRLFHQRSRHGAGPRRRFRSLRPASFAIWGGDRGCSKAWANE